VTYPLSAAPQPSYRLIPSRFPPIGVFDTVATAADMEAAMELAGWTNDRLVAERIARLPPEERVYGRANASIVMAAFLHASPTGARFSGADLGAWYASADLATGAAEVGHHLRREAAARHVPRLSRTYRAYSARLEGEHIDIRGRQSDVPEFYLSDRYAASQIFGEARRKAGDAGILYDSVRMKGGVNVVAYRPRRILDVVQADHFEITVEADARRMEVRNLAAL
jgi:hypothetical protein